ncbi:flagellar basal-body rod protein FlgB [Peribacillus deserti]|uniref:Flagellar basal body rod protein FlgB n=1 Tax=Peribacillus deserti TaxID=673318 RepID=A0ABS2QGI0_9BACI|nr:flagellar basal body rod protein FlgB [Peribacillus deserti]MBM7692271.1 flagellar basal-body rod protein FlgB [Peribacillus deserti]
MKLFSNSFTNLERALDYSSLKQKVISQNISNVDTPNYKSKDVSFKEMLAHESGTGLKAYRTNQRHFDFNGSPSANGVYTRNNMQYNHNGNSVDMDKEMSDLATNQIYYNALTERISGKFQTLQSVIKGGR